MATGASATVVVLLVAAAVASDVGGPVVVVVVVTVDDVDRACSQAEELGGKVLIPASDIPGIGPDMPKFGKKQPVSG